jgi:aspartokinase
MSVNPVTDISVTYNVSLVTLYRLPNNTKVISELFNAIAQNGINIDMINQSPPYRDSINLSFSLQSSQLLNVLSVLNDFKKKYMDLRIEIDADNTKLSVYGEGMRNVPGVAAGIFTILAEEDITVKLVTTSETDISYLIFEKDVDKATSAIKAKFSIK